METATLTTVEELYLLADSNFRHELIKGELITMSPTGILHGIFSMNLGTEIRNFIKENGIKGVVLGAETGFRLKDDTVLVPDVAFVTNERLAKIKDLDKFGEVAPNLAVEILSPSNTESKMYQKIKIFFEAGTELVWIVDPKNKVVKVYESDKKIAILSEKDVLRGGKVLPNFELNLENLFNEV